MAQIKPLLNATDLDTHFLKTRASLQAQGLTALLAHVYAQRGIESAAQVSSSELLKGTFKDLDKAVDRIISALQNQERTVIVADYDCDGATACAILARTLDACGVNVGWLVPDRKRHGYGLSTQIVSDAANGIITSDMAGLRQREQSVLLTTEQRYKIDPHNPYVQALVAPELYTAALSNNTKPKLIITVDNGTSSIEGAKLCAESGMDLLITDHHLPAAQLPEAVAIVNPNQRECYFPSKDIAGCGVAWYLSQALETRVQDMLQKGTLSYKSQGGVVSDDFAFFSSQDSLALVALGTVADVVKLDENNRRLIELGIKRLRSGMCPAGIYELAAVQVSPESINCESLGFQLGPRVNAAGRLHHMGVGIDLLLTKNSEYGAILTSYLSQTNADRKVLQEQVLEDAEAVINSIIQDQAGQLDQYTILASNPAWHQGVIGIAAGRLKEHHHRPSFVFTQQDDGSWLGSGRSIDTFHIKHALDEIATSHPSMFVKFGGHAAAAGCTVTAGQLDAFAQAFEAKAREKLCEADLERLVRIDGQLSLQNITRENAQNLAQCVWGKGFEAPTFLNNWVVQSQKKLGSSGKHIKFELTTQEELERSKITQQPAQTVEAMYFNAPHDFKTRKGTTLTLAYTLDLNEYQGQSKPVLGIKCVCEMTEGVPRVMQIDQVQETPFAYIYVDESSTNTLRPKA